MLSILKTLCCLGLGLALSASLYAQQIISPTERDSADKKYDKYAKKLDVSLEGNASVLYSRIGGNSESYAGGIPGVSVGLNLSVANPWDRVEVRTGLELAMQGGSYRDYQYEPGGNMQESKAAIRLNYLHLPLLTRYQVQDQLYLEGGVQAGLLISAQDRHGSSTDPATDLYRPLDLGLLAGVGYRSKQKWGVGLHLYQGIRNINRATGPYASVRDYNSGIALRMSYQW